MNKKIFLFAVCLLLAGCGDEMLSETPEPEKTVIVLDAGHGISSYEMTDTEKSEQGYEYNSEKKQWGEWRHYKNGTFGEDCHGEGCTRLAPEGSSCWYPMGYGDRNTEPEINLKNALTAKVYLEQMGYEVRMTRVTNGENPSMNKRASYCFPENDITKDPDAELYVCIHSNAGGGKGTSYIELSGEYAQAKISDDYAVQSNRAGDIINKSIAEVSGFQLNQPVKSPHLILFNKLPVPIAYLEIGFYDDAEDIKILETLNDKIGKAIADGVDEYIKSL